MGQDDNLHASLAHIVLCCVAGNGISKMSKSFTDPGMHANFFIHGIVGFLHYQSARLERNFKSAYVMTYKACRYLGLPCLMADLYRENRLLSFLHLASGVVPFGLYLAGDERPEFGCLMILANIVSLTVFSVLNDKEWGYYTAGAALCAHFVAPKTGRHAQYVFPMCLAVMEYCAYRLFHSSSSPQGGARGGSRPPPRAGQRAPPRK